MTTTETTPGTITDDKTADRRRAPVADSSDDDLLIDKTLPRHRQARDLLGSLLRPFRMTLALLMVVALVENVAQLSIPQLVPID